jgi:hypothetical protein
MKDTTQRQNHCSGMKRLWKGFCSRAGEINWICCRFARSLRPLEPSLAGLPLDGQYLALGQRR